MNLRRFGFNLLCLVALTLPARSAAANCQIDTCPINLNQALQIADQALQQAAVSARYQAITIKFYELPWNDAVALTKAGPPRKTLIARLRDQSYWLVQYRATSGIADAAVFVDAASGKVIYLDRELAR